MGYGLYSVATEMDTCSVKLVVVVTDEQKLTMVHVTLRVSFSS
jgi:hypothetical protein